MPAVAHVTKSNGGIMPVAAARQQTVSTLLSGPASGVIGAAYVAGAAGLDNLITLDVGGTSADIAVVEEGRPRYSTAEQIGGIPVMMPVVGVTAIGAGGGSVAWVDEVGVPKVGPQSTGAHPGPRATGAAARTPRSPTRSWSRDSSTPSASSADACGSTARSPRTPSAATPIRSGWA